MAKKDNAAVAAPAFIVPDVLLESPSFQIERLRRRTRDEVEAHLEGFDISLREYWVLTCLTAQEAASQATLSEALAVDASEMVRLIDALEDHGWAVRERDRRDRRRQIVRVTKSGRKAQLELAKLVSKAEDQALDESTSKQLKHLRKLATAIISATTEESAEH